MRVAVVMETKAMPAARRDLHPQSNVVGFVTWTDPTKRAEDVYRCPCAVGLTYVAADERFMEAASPRCDRRLQLNLGVLPTPEVVVSESLQLARGWSLRVLSHGAHSIVGELQFDGVTRADLLGATRRGHVAQADLRLRSGVRFELAGSIGGFDVREIAAQAGISRTDYPQGNGNNELVAVDLELLLALQDVLAQHLGGPVAITPFGPDSDEPLIVFDAVNDVDVDQPPS